MPSWWHSQHKIYFSHHPKTSSVRWLATHASCTSSALPKTHRTTGLAHSKSSRSSFRLKKTLSSLSTIPTSPIISKVMSIGIIRSDMLPLRAKALPMFPVRLRHAADHTSLNLVSTATPMIRQFPLMGTSGHCGFNPFRYFWTPSMLSFLNVVSF